MTMMTVQGLPMMAWMNPLLEARSMLSQAHR
eukprot:COSAG02_NODE_12627_length_1517_cov_3.346262_4_plen_30_part_01